MSDDDIDDEIVVKVSDYLDGLLSPEDKAAVEHKIASEPAWKETYDEMVETRKALSGMQKARAPGHFAKDVTETIKKRSGDRFTDLVKRTYRVLLTRGLKGCYVFFEDVATPEHIQSRGRELCDGFGNDEAHPTLEAVVPRTSQSHSRPVSRNPTRPADCGWMRTTNNDRRRGSRPMGAHRRYDY